MESLARWSEIRMYPLEMEMTCQLSKKFNWPAVNDLWTYLRDLCAAEPMSRGHFRGMVKMLITDAEQANCLDRIYEYALDQEMGSSTVYTLK